MKRRLPVLFLALVMLVSFCSVTMLGCPGKEKDDRPVLEVWSMSNEIEDLLDYYDMINGKYQFKVRVTNNDDGSYETALDNAFSNKGGPDLFVCDVDYTKKYADSDHTADLVPFYEEKFDVEGYDAVKAALEVDMYGYTLDLGTQTKGDNNYQKAVSFQVTPGAMFYRADLFLTLVDAGGIEIDGTEYDDFDALKEALELSDECDVENYTDWEPDDKVKLDECFQSFVKGDADDFVEAMDNFKEAAKIVAESDYNARFTAEKDATKKILMINNLEDMKRVYYAQREAFVQDGKVVIDESLYKFFDYAAEFYGYTHKGAQWSDSWTAGMRALNGEDTEYKTLSFFLPTWGLFYVLNTTDADGNPNPTTGLWRMVEGPQAYYWGGSYLFIGNYSKKKAEAFEVLDFLTSLPFMQARSAFSGDVMNSKALNQALAEMPPLVNPFLGNQNHFATFNSLAAQITASNVTKYDSAVDRVYADVLRRYADDKFEDLDAAIEELEATLKSNLDMEVEVKKPTP